jgi:hypothetical protein
MILPGLRNDCAGDSARYNLAPKARSSLLVRHRTDSPGEPGAKAPGTMDQEDLSAESARHERHESRLQRSPVISTRFPGAMPQAKNEIAPLALNPEDACAACGLVL